MMGPNEVVITELPLAMCILLHLPNNSISGLECATNSNRGDGDSNYCVSCSVVGKFLTGEGPEEYYSSGHLTCVAVGSLTLIIGICGILMSSVIITVFRRRNSGRSFDILLSALAWTDIVCCITAVLCAGSMMMWFQNYSRNLATLSTYYFGLMAVLLAKSASAFMTVAIAVERYLVIAFPFSSRQWLTPSKTKRLTGLVFVLSAFIGFTRWSTVYIGRNTIAGRGIASTRTLNYLIYTSFFEQVWYVHLDGIFDTFDFYAPLPLLLVLNGMILYHIRKISAKQQELNVAQTNKELAAGQMIFLIVILLFCCNVVPIMQHYFVTQGSVYAEGVFGTLLSVAINSTANLPIYYLKAPGFRSEAKSVLLSWFSNQTKHDVTTSPAAAPEQVEVSRLERSDSSRPR